MEPINFYKNGSPHQHKAVARWMRLSSVLMVATVLSCASLHVHQWYTHADLKAEKNAAADQLHQYEHVAQYQQSQKKAQTKLEKKAHYLSQHTNQNNSLELLKTIKGALKHDASLEMLACNEKNIEFRITGEKTKTLMSCVETVSKKSAYADLCITALECKEKNRFMATIKNN